MYEKLIWPSRTTLGKSQERGRAVAPGVEALDLLLLLLLSDSKRDSFVIPDTSVRSNRR